MCGKCEENYYGTDGQIVLIEYDEAAFIKDDIDNIRILFTGLKDKLKACDEAKRLSDSHEQAARHNNQFTAKGAGDKNRV